MLTLSEEKHISLGTVSVSSTQQGLENRCVEHMLLKDDMLRDVYPIPRSSWNVTAYERKVDYWNVEVIVYVI